MSTKTKAASKTEPAHIVRPSEKAPVDHEVDVAVSAGPEAESAAGERAVANEAYRELQRTNKELQVRIRELELQLAGGPEQDGGEAADYGEASDEGSSIIALIKDLHSQIEAAHELKEALEADLDSLKEKLAKEQVVRGELEAQVKLLEAKAALGEQLREDLSFVEEERNEIARRLEHTTHQLGKITAERDRLAEQNAADQARIKDLECDKITLEANVLNLEEKVADMGRLRQELADTREELQRSKEDGQSLKGRLDATEAAKNSLELELATTRELVRNQNGQIDELKESLSTARAELVDLRARLEREEIENTNLTEVNKRADHELKTLNARLESVKKELDLNKKALRNIHSAAMRTTSRPREQSSGA